MSKRSIIAQCESCRGTGLYEGFAERKGEPVICLSCSGTGAVLVRFTPYTGRKRKEGVKSVHVSRGMFIGTGVGRDGSPAMTYEQFLEKIPEYKK